MTSQLHDAAENGDMEKLQELLGAGEDANIPNEDGWTSLMLAAAEGHSDAVRLLLSNGADPLYADQKGDTALILAAWTGPDVVDALWESTAAHVDEGDAQQGWTPLIYAAQNGDSDTVRLLLERGAGVDVRDHSGMTPLLWTIISGGEGKLAVATLLLDAGADVDGQDEEGRTPLMEAEDVALVELLLKRGADVHLTSKYGYTALISAAGRCDTPIVQVLLAHGATLEDETAFRGRGATVLFHAVEAGCVDTVRLLLAAGANPNAEWSDGWTALQEAIRDGDDELIALLREAGAKG